ncbi:class I SAM-dependent methyltransferase [Natrinema salsiterrestre]|uniref:Class I SAM-dependent methyltransferase n=1 Tax=Natrinema salsiterrestre TaxID=2950540 RepID=A0A9Q4L956_9EURY|nr:class I SAM-dependent methyltransferase [Natrinema salsiterrestre]MDF9747581.1 class I SAM-dependent methyltransferase [Natrinema salsiterrestre]
MGERYDEVGELASFAGTVATAERDPVVVIAGCGAGATIEGLREHDVAAYGFDTSRSALDAMDEATREWAIEADLRDDDLVASLREAFGIDGIDVFVTECVLSFLTVEEATDALAGIRDTDGVGVLAHRVRIDPPIAAQNGDIDATVLPPAKWQAACDPADADIWRDGLEQWKLPPSGTDPADET